MQVAGSPQVDFLQKECIENGKLYSKTDIYRPTTNVLKDRHQWSPAISSPVNIWYDLKQIATEFFSAGMHSGEVSLKHTKNPLRHLWGKQVK